MTRWPVVDVRRGEGGVFSMSEVEKGWFWLLQTQSLPIAARPPPLPNRVYMYAVYTVSTAHYDYGSGARQSGDQLHPFAATPLCSSCYPVRPEKPT